MGTLFLLKKKTVVFCRKDFEKREARKRDIARIKKLKVKMGNFLEQYWKGRIIKYLMRIRILDPYWKKIYPDPGHELFFKIYWIFLTTQNGLIIFTLIFMLKLKEQFRDQEIFIISFFNSSYFVFRSKHVFWAVFVDTFPLGSGSVDPHILRIRIQEAKISRIQRIRILSTATKGETSETTIRNLYCLFLYIYDFLHL